MFSFLSPSQDTRPELDRRITAAFRDLTLARTRFAEDPSGEGLTACEEAEEKLNDLLDQRSAMTRPVPGAA